MKPTTPHDSLDDLIAAALHGDLTPEERTQFESRLSTDPNAQAAYQEAQAMHDLLEQTNRTAQPDPDFEQRMVSGVRRKLATPPHRETAWESLVALWTGPKAFFTRFRTAMRLGPLGSALAALVLIALLAGVAFGPITAGIKKANAPSGWEQAQMAAEIDSLKARQVAPSDLKRVIQQQGINYTETARNGQTMSGYVDTDYTEQFGGRGSGFGMSNNSNVALGGASSYSGAVTLNAGQTTLTHAAGDMNIVSNNATTDQSVVQQSRSFNGSLAALEKASAAPDAPATANAPEPQDINAITPSTTPVVDSAPVAANADLVASAQQVEAEKKDMGLQHEMAFQQADKLQNTTANPALPKLVPSAPAASPADTRKLIRNAQLDLEVKSYQSTFDQVAALTKAAGGYVDTSNSQRGGNGKLQGTVVVKILPENLDAFLLKLRDLGDVQNQSVSTDDVTKDYFDTQARLVNSQKMEEQLQDLLKRENGKVSDLLAVERELGRVRGDIEQMQGQLKLYDFQVQYATVTMNIAEKDLNQTAAYLLKEQDNFALYANDVEAAFQKARTAADDYKTQVLVANLQHNSGTDVSAELTVMVEPDQIEPFLSQIRELGRVANFTRQTQRVAKDGGDSSQPADLTRTDKDKVQVHLTIRSDDDNRKQVALVIVAKQVDDALDQAKAAALASTGLEILNSSLNTTPQGVSRAQLTVRVPGKEYTTLMDAFRALGRQASLNVQRNDNSGPGANGDDVPVIVSLSLTDEETPVQTTGLVLVTPNVDDQSQQIKKDAIAAGVEVKSSSFAGQPNGSHVARLTLLLPMAKYSDYLETLKKMGRVQSLSVQRTDSTGTATDDAPVEIALALTDDDPPVQETNLVMASDDVDTQAQQIKKQAADAGVEIKSSSFQRQPDGTEEADMTLRLPLGNYPAFLATLQKAGKTESLSVQRDDRPDQARPDDSAPAEIQLQLHNLAAIVPDNSGLFATLRDTFSQGFAALFGSVRVIGVILAFLAPWAITLLVLAWLGRRIYVWRKNR